jgi:hypothetical protein
VAAEPRTVLETHTLMRLLLIAAGLAASLLFWTGCGPRPQTGTPAPPAQSRPRSTATLSIISPSPGAVIAGATLHVRLGLKGGEIVPQTSINLSPDKGHIHLLLDGKVVSMAYGVEQDVPVTQGPHLLTAEYVATDHFPFNPRVTRTVTFTIR